MVGLIGAGEGGCTVMETVPWRMDPARMNDEI
jgi:hypothetical protein